MFSLEVTYVVEAAIRESKSRKHRYVCCEHILFALTFDEDTQKALTQLGANTNLIRSEVEKFFLDFLNKEHLAEDNEPSHTLGFRRTIERAALQREASGNDSVGPLDLCVALFEEQDSHARQILIQNGVKKLDLLEYLTRKTHPEQRDEDEDSDVLEDEDREHGSNTSSYLKKYTENLTKLAHEGKLDPVIGREEEVQRILQVLMRRSKNNPLLIGEPGVGKTALVNELAQRIASGNVPKQLEGVVIFSLHMGTIIAGSKFRGEFEERMRKLVDELQGLPGSILFIDEIHQLVGAGATGTGAMDAASMLKPALASGSFRCIGSTTNDDLKKSLDRDKALMRRFSPITIEEPSVELAVKIVKGLKDSFEKHHDVKYSDAALEASVELSARLLPERRLPDKAIDLLDEAGAANQMKKKRERLKTIGRQQIETVVAAIAKVPAVTVSASDTTELAALEEKLLQKIFGQSDAVQAVTQAVKRSRAQLGNDNKPIGSLLFVGPTGVGKTELAKLLAQSLGINFARFDMSEYMEKHTASRLIGAPPGYVGYEEGGLLTDQIRKTPHCVLLLDEIEKAHDDVFNILLQVMDAARLTDNHGRVADFRQVILIMTSNVGSDRSSGLGFGEKQKQSSIDKALKEKFRPEFRNRLDAVVHFNQLAPETVLQIVDKNILERAEKFQAKGIQLNVDTKARKWFAKNGFDPVLGARPLSRLIQKELTDRLVDQVLFGSLKGGGEVAVTESEGQLIVTPHPKLS